jgi:hypothetical protein
MINLVVGSAFRNSSGAQIDRWIDQVNNLSVHLAGIARVRAVAVEGDSTDDTRRQLWDKTRGALFDFSLIKCDHGGPVFGSVESVERMKCLSKVGNAILDEVRESDDYLWYVESDLIWVPGVIDHLLLLTADTAAPLVDVVAPLVFAGANFYDVWGFRGLDGSRFAPFAPYHSSLSNITLTEVSSVGSALMIRGEVARRIRFTDGALVEWCANARTAGYHIYVAPWLRIDHP